MIDSNPAGEGRRVSVHFSDQTYKVLKELANGGSIADAIRDAIALTKWFKDTQNEGKTILVEDRNGKLREVIKI